MKDPTRLLDAAASPPELRILRAGATEEPPAEAVQRLAAKLGVQLPAALDVAAASTASSSALAAGAAVGFSAKLTLVLVASTLGLAGAVWIATRPIMTSAVSKGSASANAGREVSQPKAVALNLEPQPPSAAAVSAPPAAMNSRALTEEIARVDTIRQLLAHNRASSAIAALGDYERDYPRGALQQEATLLRIEALRRKGDRTQARTLAERFLRDHPESPHAPRVRALAFDGANAR
jgi:hypothetical protein